MAVGCPLWLWERCNRKESGGRPRSSVFRCSTCTCAGNSACSTTVNLGSLMCTENFMNWSWFRRAKHLAVISDIRVHHLLLGRDDQQVIEEVEVDVDERQSGGVGGVHTQLPHGALAHQKAPTNNQWNWLEGWRKRRIRVRGHLQLYATIKCVKPVET